MLINMKPYTIEDGKKVREVIKRIKESRDTVRVHSDMFIFDKYMDEKQIRRVWEAFNNAMSSYSNNVENLMRQRISHL